MLNMLKFFQLWLDFAQYFNVWTFLRISCARTITSRNDVNMQRTNIGTFHPYSLHLSFLLPLHHLVFLSAKPCRWPQPSWHHLTHNFLMATNKISIRLFHGSIHLLIPPTRPSAVLVTSKRYSQCIYAHILNIVSYLALSGSFTDCFTSLLAQYHCPDDRHIQQLQQIHRYKTVNWWVPLKAT